MLTQLHIRNLAVISELLVEMSSGMTVLTGETGAGKSILIDALGLAIGDRADSSMVRSGAERAEVSATFSLSSGTEVAQWLQDKAYDQNGELVLRRLINRDGRSRAFINGTPAPLQALQELGEKLVDIHSQHAHQSLLRRAEQRRLLDEYGGLVEIGNALAALVRDYRTSSRQATQLREAARDRLSRMEFIRYQIQELRGRVPSPNELTQLEEEHARLSHAERLKTGASQLYHLLYQGDESLQTGLAKAVSELGHLQRIDPKLGEPMGMLEEAMIQVQEAANSLRAYREGLDLDLGTLQQIETRLAEIQDLARKYRVPPHELSRLLLDLETELETLDQADFRLGELEQQEESLRLRYRDLAAELSRRRAEAAERLATAVSEQLSYLGMGGGRFSLHLEPHTEAEPNPSGQEEVEFVVALNPGLPHQPLAKVASGGELSRISLGIRVVTARYGRIPTLVFDEVDVGIGGRVAEIVGRLLRALGADRQVLCVTHLPQVAAMGTEHLQVSKEISHQMTLISLRHLSPEQRVEEIARMLGGIEITPQTLAHAREMVERSGRS